MFESLTYKHKFLVLIGVFLLLIVASYKMSLKRTFETRASLLETESKLKQVKESGLDISQLKQKELFLDRQIGSAEDVELVPHLIIDFISQYNKVKISNIDTEHQYADTNFMIYTNRVTVEGDYNNLIRLLYDLELKFNSSRIINAKFFKKKNYKLRKEQLFLELTFQNYEKK